MRAPDTETDPKEGTGKAKPNCPCEGYSAGITKEPSAELIGTTVAAAMPLNDGWPSNEGCKRN